MILQRLDGKGLAGIVLDDRATLLVDGGIPRVRIKNPSPDAAVHPAKRDPCASSAIEILLDAWLDHASQGHAPQERRHVTSGLFVSHAHYDHVMSLACMHDSALGQEGKDRVAGPGTTGQRGRGIQVMDPVVHPPGEFLISSVDAMKLSMRRFSKKPASASFNSFALETFEQGQELGLPVELVPTGHSIDARALVLHEGAGVKGEPMEPVDHPASRESQYEMVAGAARKDTATLVYTGDFITEPGRLLPPLEPRQTRLLACECTFGLPAFEFPPFDQTRRAVQDWVEDGLGNGTGIILLGYPLGKNQEILSLLEPFRATSTIIADEETCFITRMCKDRGIDLPEPVPYKNLSRKRKFWQEEPWILVLPRHAFHSARFTRFSYLPCRTAVFSGKVLDHHWLDSMHVDEGFPLTAHPGFWQLVDFIEASQPATVVTCHGRGTLLRRKLVERRLQGLEGAIGRDCRIIPLATT